jgi:hypothetical protein
LGGSVNPQPSLQVVDKPSVINLFEALFPVDFLKAVVLPESNKVVNTAVLYGELLLLFSLWFLMATTNGSH